MESELVAMPISFSFEQLERYKKLNDGLAQIAQEKYRKYPYELAIEQYKEVLREFRKREKEKRELEHKKAKAQAREEVAKETWHMSTENYLKYIEEQKEKWRLLRMVRRWRRISNAQIY